MPSLTLALAAVLIFAVVTILFFPHRTWPLLKMRLFYESHGDVYLCSKVFGVMGGHIQNVPRKQAAQMGRQYEEPFRCARDIVRPCSSHNLVARLASFSKAVP